MKSEQKDNIQTSCKSCVFAIYDDNQKTQISCVHDRINKFQPRVLEAYDEEKEFYVIQRLCSYYRESRWGYTKDDSEKVISESATSYDIIFNCNHIDEQKCSKIITIVNNNAYFSKKIKIILIHERKYYKSVKNKIEKIYQLSNSKPDITICDDIDEHIKHLVKKSKNMFHIIYDDVENTNMEFLSKINDKINNDMKNLAIISTQNLKIINNFAYNICDRIDPANGYKQGLNRFIEIWKDTGFCIDI